MVLVKRFVMLIMPTTTIIIIIVVAAAGVMHGCCILNGKQVLSLVLPMLVAALVVCFVAVGIYYMLVRAKYGAICCFNPVS